MRNRIVSGAIILSLACCHVTTLAAIALDATSSGKATYSTGSGRPTSGGSGTEDLCGVIPGTGCTAGRDLRHPSGLSHLLEKRSSDGSIISSEIQADSSADGSAEEGDEFRGQSANRPRTGNRMLWNVPFRKPYGDADKRKFMFGKRDFSEEEEVEDWKRSGGKERNTGKFKFGKRPTEETGSEEPETGYDGHLDDATAMTSPGSKIPDLERNEGSSSGGKTKRKFKFGKKSDPPEEENRFQEEEEEEEEENEEAMEEEKRKIMFGKRAEDGYGTLEEEEEGDGGDSVESKRRAKFQFGKRSKQHQIYPFEVFPKLKTKFKLGK